MDIASFFGQAIGVVLGTIIVLKIITALLETSVSRKSYLYACVGTLTGSFSFRLLNFYVENTEIASGLPLKNIFSICFLLGMSIILFSRLFNYFRLKNKAGKMIKALKCNHSSMRFYRFTLAISCTLFIIYTLLFFTFLYINLNSLNIERDDNPLSLEAILLSLILLLIIISCKICIAGRLEIREHTLLYLDSAIRWHEINSYKWEKTNKGNSEFAFLTFYLKKNRSWLKPSVISIELPSSHEAIVEAALKEISIARRI